MTLSFKEVAEILKIIDASQCEEVVLEQDGMRLVVRRGVEAEASRPPLDTAAGRRPTTEHQGTPAAATAIPRSVEVPSSVPETTGLTVRSPMVGTFYRSPSPDEPPFVDIDSAVGIGDPLCLIEVMKLYTTIEASCAGVVRAVLADDSKLVEFDQPLFLIEPA